MIQFHFHPSPNPLKIALYLEETGLPYELVPVDTRKGEQHSEAFKAINPNAKTPAMLDGETRVFDSNAMLLYLAEKTGRFEPKAYAVNRYDFEAWRHWTIVNDHLATRAWMLGDEYTFVDMAVWGWARVVPFVLGGDAWEKLPHVKRLLDEINARPAAQRAEALKTRFQFKAEVDEDARKVLFPQNARLVDAGN